MSPTDGEAHDVAADLIGPVRPHPGRPHVVLKYAQTLDGRIAAAGGDSKWISCEQERAVSHALRARCDAVVVGAGTAVRDDPRLDVRLVPGTSPLRVVLDSTLRIPAAARLFAGPPGTVLITTAHATTAARDRVTRCGAAVWEVPAGPGGVDLPAALGALHGAGARTVMVEGGARLLTSLLAAGLADRIVVGIAPRIIGSGVEAIGDLGTTRVADGIALRRACVRPVEDDVVVAYDVRPDRR